MLNDLFFLSEPTGHLHHAGESHEGSSCGANSLMSSIVETAGPYLYPCTIEYSLICAGEFQHGVQSARPALAKLLNKITYISNPTSGIDDINDKLFCE